MVLAAHYGSAFQILLVFAAIFPLAFAFAAARRSHEAITISIAMTILGVASMRDMARLGRIGLKAIVYFEVVSTFALVLGLLAADGLLGAAQVRLAAAARPPPAPPSPAPAPPALTVACLHAQLLAPKRRRRDSYSARDCSKASRVKSGHSSSRKTNSE
jgi:hypothetical protein